MISLLEVKKINHEELRSINIENNVMKMLKPKVNEMVQSFFKKNNHNFSEDVDTNILTEIETIRNKVLKMLDTKCSEIIREFDNNYEKFCFDHGWYSHIAARTRHKITRDELSYELCEIIRKLYFVYLEEQFPKQYRMRTVEEYLLKEH